MPPLVLKELTLLVLPKLQEQESTPRKRKGLFLLPKNWFFRMLYAILIRDTGSGSTTEEIVLSTTMIKCGARVLPHVSKLCLLEFVVCEQ
mmetsp:Transcript_15487/g.39023  ORF Transcript_15487/g.39023 Transcript_15487/m.39023 type:complete len:90 (+) Transcript_15487:26-295(+)